MTTNTNLSLGTGDRPTKIKAIGFEVCDDGHPQVVYPALLITIGGAVRGACPACAGAAAARAERLERIADELPEEGA